MIHHILREQGIRYLLKRELTLLILDEGDFHGRMLGDAIVERSKIQIDGDVAMLPSVTVQSHAAGNIQSVGIYDRSAQVMLYEEELPEPQPVLVGEEVELEGLKIDLTVDP